MLSSKSLSVSRTYLLIAGLILLCFSVPAMPQTFFNGIPFDSLLEFAVSCVTLIGVLLRLKERNSGRFGQLNYGKKAIGFLLVVLVLRLISAYGVSSSDGFSSCYRAITAPLDSGDCEKSYEGLFSTGDVKALAQHIKTAINDKDFSKRLVKSYSSQLNLFDPSTMNLNIMNLYSNASF